MAKIIRAYSGRKQTKNFILPQQDNPDYLPKIVGRTDGRKKMF